MIAAKTIVSVQPQNQIQNQTMTVSRRIGRTNTGIRIEAKFGTAL